MTELTLLEDGPADAERHLLLAHGAGAAMDSPFLNTVAALLAERGIATARFEFDYMASRRVSPKRKPPPKAELLVQQYESAVQLVRGRMTPTARLFIGGKSMGGRVASMIAGRLHADGQISGLICLGYPFHPPKKPEQLRTVHLVDMTCPALIVQGDRDPFGGRSEVEAMALSQQIIFHWVPDGDHDLAPRGASGFTRRGNLEAAADAVVAFMS
jgi:uncharacterized protein